MDLAAEIDLLDALDVAVGVVVEDDGDERRCCAAPWSPARCIVKPKPPSPLIETTGRSGSPTFAPSAVQKP